jgi:transposase
VSALPVAPDPTTEDRKRRLNVDLFILDDSCETEVRRNRDTTCLRQCLPIYFRSTRGMLRLQATTSRLTSVKFKGGNNH